MASETSVVTPERYATGIPSYSDWMSAIGQRQAEFQRHYDEYEPEAADLAQLQGYVDQHGVKALALGEDWCPDVWRGMPVIFKLGERTGMEVRAFMRDQNKDIMSEFLNQGEFESIPTIVLYDRDHKYLGHWIERAKLANEEMPKVRASIAPNPMPERDTAEYTAYTDKSREAMIDAAGPWRHAQLKEILEILGGALE